MQNRIAGDPVEDGDTPESVELGMGLLAAMQQTPSTSTVTA